MAQMYEYTNGTPPKLPKRANRTVTYTKEIKYCSECPMCRESMVYYDRAVDQDVQDLFCTGTNSKEPVMTHWALHWTEIADRNSRHEGDDYVPETCPLLKNEPSREPDGNPSHEPDDEPVNRYSEFYRLKNDSLKSE